MSKFINLVYDYAQSWPQKHYEYISPSSLGGCMRSHFFKLKGVEMTTPPNPGALLNFELGRLWEQPIEKALQHAGVPFVSQLKLVDEEYGVGGTLDLAVFDRETEEWELVSIKTEGAMKAKYRAREKKNFFESNPEYAVQEEVYRWLMERNGFKVKDTASYIVITKDNGFLDEPVLAFSPQLKKATFQRIKKLRQYLDEDELPPCSCEGWKVNYCNYGDPDTIEVNKTGKSVPMECCNEELYATDN